MPGTLTAFLCLGLTLGLGTPLLTRSLPEPVIRAEPGSVVANGSQVTIICEGTPGAQNYYLYQLGNQSSSQRLTLRKPGNTAKFLIPIIQRFHAGRYHCFYHKPPSWSKKSNILELVVTGQLHGTPSLSVHPGRRVSSGENVTLLCQSSHQTDSFFLSKEGTAHLRLYLRSVLQDKLYQAKFFMRNVTVAHGGTYKCYSSEDLYPYLLSYPSNPVKLVVSRSSDDPDSLSQEPILTSGLKRYLKVLFGIAVAFLLLLLFLTLLLLHFKHQEKRRKTARRETTSVRLLADAVEPVTRDRGPQKSSISADERKKILSREMPKVSVHRATGEALVSKL